MNAPAPLAGMQRRFSQWLLHHETQAAPAIHAAGLASPAARLRVYADGYRWRLVDVLGHDFPVLRACLGGDRFDALALAYLAAHPSQQPSVRHLGARFTRWLGTQAADASAMVDLARLEWAQGEVFDAADAPTCTSDDLISVSPDAWPALRLMLHPAVRRLRLRSNAVALLDAHGRGAPLPALQVAPATTWLLWRHDFDVHWRRLPRDEAMAFAAVARGAPFADWCGRLPGRTPALRAAALLKRWLTDGLVAGLSPTP